MALVFIFWINYQYSGVISKECKAIHSISPSFKMLMIVSLILENEEFSPGLTNNNIIESSFALSSRPILQPVFESIEFMIDKESGD